MVAMYNPLMPGGAITQPWQNAVSGAARNNVQTLAPNGYNPQLGGAQGNFANNPMYQAWVANGSRTDAPSYLASQSGAQSQGGMPNGVTANMSPHGGWYSGNAGQAGYQTAANPYIGQQAQGAAGAPSVLGYAQQIAEQGKAANPYLGQSAGQIGAPGSNPYAGPNPYLDQNIQATADAATRNFNAVVNPQFDRMAAASGSFGNTGVEEARGRAMGEFGSNLANTIGGMRMQDYTAQQGLAENALNRTMQADQFNAGLRSGDLNRNLAGAFTGQDLGMRGLSNVLGAAQFDAGNTMGNNQFNAGLGANDLSRNSQLAQQLGMFNTGAGNTAAMFNAGAANDMSRFNAGMGNQAIRDYFNLAENSRQFDAGLGQRSNEFDQTFREGQRRYEGDADFRTWMANVNNMRQGQRDQMDWLRQLYDMQTGGIGAATNVQNAPINYWQQFMNSLNQTGGLGGTNTIPLQGNPMMSGIGGYLAGQQLFGGGQGYGG